MKKYIEATIWQFKALQYALCALVVAVPLYVSHAHLSPFATPKTLLIIMGAIILGGLYLWGRARERESILTISWEHLVLSVFVTILVISGLNAAVPHFAFFGGMEGEGILMICAFAIIASVIGFLVKKDDKFIVTLGSWSMTTAVVVVVALYGGDSMVSQSGDASTVGNTSYVGPYLLINICLALGLFIIHKQIWKRITIAVAGLFIITSPVLFNTDIFKGVVSIKDVAANPLLLSGSANGAVLGLGTAIAAIGALFLVRSRKALWQWIGVIALVGLFVGIYAAGQSFMNPSSSLHQTYVAEKSSNRFLFWDIASSASNERPLLGWGINGYSYAFQEHFSSTFFSPGYVTELWTNNPHNMFREYQVNTGIIGLVGYLMLLGTTGIVLFIRSRSTDRTQKIISIVLFGAILGYVIQNLFVFDTVVPLMMFYIIVGYAISVSGFKTITLPSSYKKFKIGVAIIVTVGLSYGFVVAGAKPWQESKAWAVYTSKNKIPLEPTPQTISQMGYAGDTAYLADKLIRYFDSSIDLQKITEDQKRHYIKTFEVLIQNLKDDIVRDGYPNFRAEWKLGQSYISLLKIKGAYDQELLDEAQVHFQRAIDINPTNPLVYIDMAQSLAVGRDFRGARAWTRATIALNPEYRGGYMLAERIIRIGGGDKAFEQYVVVMRDKWCQKDSLCATGKWK